ncbi:MAG: hypothetical protein LAO06_00595 [Acidobacteriia bacterium]|nr:hypothetical protein [Terriglobia bacterium]
MPKAIAARRSSTADFAATFRELKTILEPYGDKLRAAHDKPSYYYLETHDKPYRGRAIMFAAVRTGKAYVSFHLFPLYTCPRMTAGMSPALKKRMQGKTCFNFTAPDPTLFAELKKLTAEGFKLFKDIKLP